MFIDEIVGHRFGVDAIPEERGEDWDSDPPSLCLMGSNDIEET